MKNELVNDMSKETNNFPKTIVDMVCLINDYKGTRVHLYKSTNEGGNAVAFAQRGTTPINQIKCHQCGVLGHYKLNCPNLGVTGTAGGYV